jgi:predicted small integral membrane protein
MTNARRQDDGRVTALERASRGLVLFVLLLLATEVALAVVGLRSYEVPTSRNASFVDNVFASWIVILAARMALLFGAAYIAVSVVGLIASRRWLAQLGPFKVSDPIARFDCNAVAVDEEMKDAAEAVQDLERELMSSDTALAESQADNRRLLTYIDMLDERQGRNRGI